MCKLKENLIQQVVTQASCPDPIDLYETLCLNNNGETALFISMDEVSKKYKYSLISVKNAIRIEYRHSTLEITGLTPIGKEILKKLLGYSTGYKKILYTNDHLTKNKVYSEDERLKLSSPFDILRKLLTFFNSNDNLPDCTKMLVYIFSFELISFFEKFATFKNDPLEFPDYIAYFPEELIVIEHSKNQTHYSTIGKSPINLQEKTNPASKNPIPSLNNKKDINEKKHQVSVTPSEQEFTKLVETCKKHILQGDIFQGVISKRFSIPCYSPFNAFKQLVQSNLSEYAFYFKSKQHILFGASPETSIKIECQSNNKIVSIHPIAGTRTRGFDQQGQLNQERDLREEASLRLSQKELAEHMMLVDLARNDISRISIPGTTFVKELATIKRYAKVMHMCSVVQGTLKPEIDAFHAYTACMNMGTLCGAPKIKATEILQQCEKSRRGPYGGAIGWVSPNQEMDCAIIIRSALVHNNIAYIQSGAGIVADSCPNEEAQEIQNKAQAVINAIITGENDVSKNTCDYD